VLVFDNCNDNKNNNVVLGFTQLLVDFGFFEVVIVAFFIQYHGKWLCDNRYGAQEKLFRRRCAVPYFS
jgi:hypothetical protein